MWGQKTGGEHIRSPARNSCDHHRLLFFLLCLKIFHCCVLPLLKYLIIYFTILFWDTCHPVYKCHWWTCPVKVDLYCVLWYDFLCLHFSIIYIIKKIWYFVSMELSLMHKHVRSWKKYVLVHVSLMCSWTLIIV